MCVSAAIVLAATALGAQRPTTRTPAASVAFQQAVAAHLEGRDIEAVASLRRALESDPGLTVASELLGVLLYRQAQTDEAIRVYEQALARSPDARVIAERLRDWKSESAVHDGLIERTDGRFSIIFDGERDATLASRAVQVLDAAFWRIGQALGAYPDDRVTVTLYTDKQFRDITRAPAWAGGKFDGKVRIPIRGASDELPRFDRVLVHELTHAMIYGLAPRDVPAWVHEGLASWFEGRSVRAAEDHLRRAGVRLPLSALTAPFSQFTETDAVLAYDESLVAADLLLQITGVQTGLLLQRVGEGESFAASLDRFGVTLADLDGEIAARLGQL
jgi:tetratricopeptide (TPR) repeat protein